MKKHPYELSSLRSTKRLYYEKDSLALARQPPNAYGLTCNSEAIEVNIGKLDCYISPCKFNDDITCIYCRSI